MNDNDFAADMNAQEVLGAFLREMIEIHGCSFEEAFEVIHSEIRREFDRRVHERRAALRVIQTDRHSGGAA